MMLHARLREVRRAKGLTLQQVAERIDPPTTAQTIGRLETGMRNLTIDWLEKIARGLSVDPAELLALPEGGDIVVSGVAGADGIVKADHQQVVTLRLDAKQPVAVRMGSDSAGYRSGDIVVCDRSLAVAVGSAADGLVETGDGRTYFGKLVRQEDRLLFAPGAASGAVIALDTASMVAPALTLIRPLRG